MVVQDPHKALSASFKRQRAVVNPIAADSWTFKDATGKRRTARLEVGRPQPIPNDRHGDWVTPVFIEHYTGHVVPAFGVGPIDSLMNAVDVLRNFQEQIGWAQISQASAKSRIAKLR